MPLMTCRPGAGLWTRDSIHYQDDGSGEVFVADEHCAEALMIGWKSLTIDVDSGDADVDPGDVHEEPDESPQSAEVSDKRQRERSDYQDMVDDARSKGNIGPIGPVGPPSTPELTTEEPTSPKRSARR